MATISIQFKDGKDKNGDTVTVSLVPARKLNSKKLTRAQEMAVHAMNALNAVGKAGAFGNTAVTEV